MSEPLTSEHDSSSLLGTPNSHERTRSPRSVDHGVQLANQVALLQTPSAADAMGGHLSRGGDRSHELLLKGQVKALLPTPTTDGANNTTRASGDFQSLARTAHLLPTPMSSTYEQGGDGGELRAALTHGPSRRLPTPTARDGKGGNTPGDSLPDAVKLLPTPTAQASKHGETPDLTANGSGYNLWDIPRLLPTHRTNATRTGRGAMVDNQQWSAPSLEQALEISQGILPREFNSWDEVPGWSGASTSPPSDDGNTPPDDPLHGQLTIEAD